MISANSRSWVSSGCSRSLTSSKAPFSPRATAVWTFIHLNPQPPLPPPPLPFFLFPRSSPQPRLPFLSLSSNDFTSRGQNRYASIVCTCTSLPDLFSGGTLPWPAGPVNRWSRDRGWAGVTVDKWWPATTKQAVMRICERHWSTVAVFFFLLRPTMKHCDSSFFTFLSVLSLLRPTLKHCDSSFFTATDNEALWQFFLYFSFSSFFTATDIEALWQFFLYFSFSSFFTATYTEALWQFFTATVKKEGGREKGRGVGGKGGG